MVDSLTGDSEIDDSATLNSLSSKVHVSCVVFR